MTVFTRLCLCLGLTLGGCAAVPQNQVAPVTLPSPVNEAQKPSVHVSVSHYFGSPLPHQLAGSLKGAGLETDTQRLQRLAALSPLAPVGVQQNTTQQVRQILDETGLFAHVSMNGEAVRPGDYQLDLSVYTYWPFSAGEALASMATLVTLGLVPSSRPQEFKLILSLHGPDKQPLAWAANSDAIDQRVGLVNLVRLGDTEEKAEYDTLKRQVNALLLNAVQRGLIPELTQASEARHG
ncbi:hypothetical protein [Pseudomonas entomophila]|uniref:Lipoprotein n=2 Tax=Pseudomonas entomophila TaxID=312306 RepID=Q1IAI8_PSEE4|nr:hypothetical protein [Pseudomonas entomophila]WMW03903.1 hypothetical protein RAH46_16355 [Pseudomonas entomophila]CAK15331.1 hypothetical protein PSEEN2527 [Pseudomonas entomophila L48]